MEPADEKLKKEHVCAKATLLQSSRCVLVLPWEQKMLLKDLQI